MRTRLLPTSTRVPRSTPARRLVCVALLACTRCGGGGEPAGTSPEPAIESVVPAAAWCDETVTLAITGRDTHWTPAAPPAVVVGDDVVIESVTVDGPASLRVAMHPAFDARTGPRFLYVGVGGSLFAVAPAFEVRAPVVASWFSEPFVRPSVLVGSVFPGRAGDVLDGPVRAVARSGEDLPLYLDDPHGFIVVVPETAPVGWFDLYVHRTGPNGTATVRVPAGSIASRAVVLTSFPSTVSLPTVDGTALHRFTTTSDCLLEFPLTSPDPTPPIHFLFAHQSPFAPPVVGLAPVRHGSAGVGPRSVALAGETFDVIVFAGHATYTLDATQAQAPVVAEVEPNDGASTAQPVVLPVLVAPAAVDSGATDDVYSFVVPVADVGRRVRVVGAPGASLDVALFRSDKATVLGAGSATGAGAAVDLRSLAIPAAETLYLRVRSAASASMPDSTSAYRLFIRFEDP